MLCPYGNRPIIPQHRPRRLAPPTLADNCVTGEVVHRSLSLNRSSRTGTLELTSAILLSSHRLPVIRRRVAVALGNSVSQHQKTLTGEVVHLSTEFGSSLNIPRGRTLVPLSLWFP